VAFKFKKVAMKIGSDYMGIQSTIEPAVA